MRPIRPANKVFIPLFVVAVALIASWGSQRPAKSSFDFYLLTLTSHPAFCADGHARKPECRTAGAIPISIHGLWPERLEPGRYPHDCDGPPLDLESGTKRDLARLMPGMVDGLHEHEWRKHGTCSGIDDDRYFGFAASQAAAVDRVLGRQLTTLAGTRVRIDDLRRSIDAASAGMSNTLTFHCRTLRDAPVEQRRDPFLIEIRQCLERKDDGSPGKPVSCASVRRRDQGCGGSFRIAAAR